MLTSTAGRGGLPGTEEAARTDDPTAIIRIQMSKLPPGPKMIWGDFNGSLEAFPTICDMSKEEGWTGIGNDTTKCSGRPGQPTCHTNAEVKESRIDYVITNDRLTPAVMSCKVDNEADYPTR